MTFFNTSPISSQEIRKRFLSYFKKKEHVLVPSSPTVPHDDPSLLFINAGMNQFKDLFLGKSQRDYVCATSSQKCIRVGGKHNDLDNVGHTSLHMTFFEMLGNFSFGNYFKQEALAYAWEVSTKIFQFDPKRLWVSVFETDDETFELWKEFIDEKRIFRLGEKDNFWSMGETGPCGPCSELLYDRGEQFGSAIHPKDDKKGERYSEFWNLVFMQYNRDGMGNTLPLPKPCVDTGAGLERVMLCMMNLSNVFQTDVLKELITCIEELSGKPYYPHDPHHAPAFHIIADHIRSLAFAIADGAQPSNTDRGYVLRKILRRAVRYGRLLGFDAPFLANILPTLIKMMGKEFHELISAQEQISTILTIEEESFLRTLQRGGNILHNIIKKGKKSACKEISGEDAFKLKDTYGFPLEEILLIAKDANLTINLDTYKLLEKKARTRSRLAKTTHHQEVLPSLFETFIQHHGTCEFVGYDKEKIEGSIKGIIIDGKFVDMMEKGQKGSVILDLTPFYAERGGQVADIGLLSHERALFVVEDCQFPHSKVIAHHGKLKEGVLIMGEPIIAEIDSKRRKEIAKHHTATHLLHFALQKILGCHIRQMGSLVEADRLRFDFNHYQSLNSKDLRQIEALVNNKIWENDYVKTYQLPFKEIHNHPEIKQFFGDKYDEMVRVVDINHFSQELCGGTHLKNTGEIGYFRIIKEESIAKGIRRIEGVIGPRADTFRYQSEELLQKLSTLFKSPPSNLERAATYILKENLELKKQIRIMRKEYLSNLATNLMQEVKKIGPISIICAVVNISRDEWIAFANDLLKHLQSGIVFLCLFEEQKCHLLLKVSPDLVSKGINANTLIQSVTQIIRGSGGGKQELAQASGTNTKGIVIAFDKVQKMLKECCRNMQK